MAGLLDGFFRAVDPILDDIDPLHNKVQTWTTGSSTTDGQSPYFQTIAPIILDMFLPGAGSAVRAADNASTGNYTGAALSALAAYGGMGGMGSTASSGADGGLAATESTGSGLASTGGQAAGTTATAGEVASNADTVNAAREAANASQYGQTYDGSVNTFGHPTSQGLARNSLDYGSTAPTNTQFMTIPNSQFSAAAGVGGNGQGLGTTAAEAAATQAGKPWYANLASGSTGKAAGLLGEQMLKAEAQKEQRNADMRNRAMSAMGQIASPGDNAPKSFSVQRASPYAQFNGGFQPRRYGANVRQSGLLG